MDLDLTRDEMMKELKKVSSLFNERCWISKIHAYITEADISARCGRSAVGPVGGYLPQICDPQT